MAISINEKKKKKTPKGDSKKTANSQNIFPAAYKYFSS